jgi:hypothetical protein
VAVMRKRLYASLVVLVGVTALSGPLWRVRAQNRPLDSVNAVRSVDPKASPGRPTTADRGATYHAIENQAIRVTTTFVDATVSGERATDGKLTSRVLDSGGNELATFKVIHIDSGNDRLSFSIAEREIVSASPRGGLRPTLDWSNQQAYSLWKDHVREGTALEWQDALMRAGGASPRPQDWNALETRTEWGGGLSAVARRRRGPEINVLTGKPIAGDVVVSHISRDGLEVGVSYYYPADRLFAWSLPDLTEGYVDPKRLSAVGGWPITPDMGWMNTQNLAFYQFHTALKQPGSPEQGRRIGWLDRFEQFFAPSVRADTAGCDGLHWLDGTQFRPCCDEHDRCYASYGCAAYTWWWWGGPWQCEFCNAFVVFCFETGGHVLFRIG